MSVYSLWMFSSEKSFFCHQLRTGGCFKCCHLEEAPTRQVTYSAARTPTVGTLIVLPDYYRAGETESRCFVEGYQRHYKRNQITNNRLCGIHLSYTSWNFPKCISDNIINTFSANQVQVMFSLKDSDCNFFGFR